MDDFEEVEKVQNADSGSNVADDDEPAVLQSEAPENANEPALVEENAEVPDTVKEPQVEEEKEGKVGQEENAEQGGESDESATHADAASADVNQVDVENVDKVDIENVDKVDVDKVDVEHVDQVGVENVDQVEVEKVDQATVGHVDQDDFENVEHSDINDNSGAAEGDKPMQETELSESADQAEERKSVGDDPPPEEAGEGKEKTTDEAEVKEVIPTEGERDEAGASPQQTEEQAEEQPGEEEEALDQGEGKLSPDVQDSLSRVESPDVFAAPDTAQLEATSPDLQGAIDEEQDEDETETALESPVPAPPEQPLEYEGPSREAIIEKYLEALANREMLLQHNTSLQHRLAEHFKKKKTEERPEYEKNVSDQEQRYIKYLAQLEELRFQYATEKQIFHSQIEDLKHKCQERKERVDAERRKFIEYKQDIAVHAIFGRSGKAIPPKDIEQVLALEAKKEQEVVNVRLENIKLKNKLKKKEQQLKSKEELADGLHLIDFEQLKIENQTYNEKIEERNEELLKLRKKITSTVQVLTHLKEKLQFVQGANMSQNEELQEVEASLAKSRDILSRTKQARDALRIDNQKLRQNSGLLGNEPLLRDFELQKDEAVELASKLDQLKMKHAEMTLTCNQVRRKIDQARQSTV
ncbi:unnamed protein product [Lymnaea stagnalis]|uniref:CCDC113/CCDC96 coiled-coil domain-containing protein n=1 Tax=Lymnaea stagnalis TaxID=6523 RepID=A0AAV2IBI5_LYMST